MLAAVENRVGKGRGGGGTVGGWRGIHAGGVGGWWECDMDGVGLPWKRE